MPNHEDEGTSIKKLIGRRQTKDSLFQAREKCTLRGSPLGLFVFSSLSLLESRENICESKLSSSTETKNLNFEITKDKKSVHILFQTE